MKNKLLTVEEVMFEDLPLEYQKFQPDDGCGKESTEYLVIRYKGEILSIESDAMEPEDARFYRDLSWIKPMIERAYELGVSESKSNG
jgi:hypothetical protein